MSPAAPPLVELRGVSEHCGVSEHYGVDEYCGDLHVLRTPTSPSAVPPCSPARGLRPDLSGRQGALPGGQSVPRRVFGVPRCVAAG